MGVYYTNPVTPRNVFDSLLVEHFEVLSFDPRGIGQSNSPNEQPTMLDYAEDMKKLMDALGWSDAYILGESFGGMVAQEFALNFSACVKKLVLIVTSSGGAGGSSFPYHEHDISAMNDEEKAHFWVQCSDTRLESEGWKEANTQKYHQQFSAYYKVFKMSRANPNNALFSSRQISARKHHDTYERLSAIDVETYICGGHFDKTAPINNQLSLLNQIPNARLTMFHGSHMLLWQDNFSFKSIAQFLINK
ncbi:alpha/beta fold hydrolase [Piscirickettsia litoralis]|uniref:AB hydrolase-1 domain-containing protein n=1 Tax=Piscirickettsia litoralis TaxID=1891921 RepID=A0ABX3A1U9_9GAMM|nr:alpha/beta hydrolase [Piscirickettsia litoralis]ODN41603.1 hypothetical protein BGC07_16030 [Piscirickettsia litoralis]